MRLLEPKNGFLKPILEFLITKITKRLGASRKNVLLQKTVIQRKFRLPFLFQTTLFDEIMKQRYSEDRPSS